MNKFISNDDAVGFPRDRRYFLKSLTAGITGGTLGMVTGRASAAVKKPPGKSRVSFVTGNDRRDIIYQVLKPFEKEIREGIRGKQVIIKPNCVIDYNPLCATHPDAMRGLLDFLKPMYNRQVIIGESTASPNGTMYCYEKYNYLPLANEYNVKLVDINLGPYTNEWILGSNGHPLDVKIIEAFQKPDNYIISLTRTKTHTGAIITLGVKNIVMAAPANFLPGHKDFIRNKQEKSKMHQGGYLGLNYNIFLIARKTRPQLSILDGVEGMEGNGPAKGTPVEHGIALASLDVIASDRVGVELMGMDFADIAYLQWCANAGLGQGNLDKIEIIGPDPKKYVIQYKPPDNIEKLLKWKDEG